MALAQHSVVTEDARVIVNRFDFAPGDETGHHTHALPYIIVPLCDGRVRVTDASGGESHADMVKDVPYSRPAGVSHNVINAADTALSFLEIEMKS